MQHRDLEAQHARYDERMHEPEPQLQRYEGFRRRPYVLQSQIQDSLHDEPRQLAAESEASEENSASSDEAEETE